MPNDTDWSVIDLNAVALMPNSDQIAPRIHDTRPGRRWPLRSDVGCPMPEQDARMFLKDPAFVVRDNRDEIVVGLAGRQIERTPPKEMLPPRIVMADLDELTDAALLTRAAVHPAFTTLPPKPDRALMVDFLEGLFTVQSPRGFDDVVLGEDARENTADLAARMLDG